MRECPIGNGECHSKHCIDGCAQDAGPALRAAMAASVAVLTGTDPRDAEIARLRKDLAAALAKIAAHNAAMDLRCSLRQEVMQSNWDCAAHTHGCEDCPRHYRIEVDA